MTQRIKVGSFGNPHGVRGQVCLRSFTENPKDILSYSPLTDESGKRVFSLKCDGIKGEELIVSIAGLTDRNAAELLKRTGIYAPAEALPDKDDDTWYSSELIGLQAITQDGKIYGNVIAVHDFGAGDIIELELSDGKNEMLPFKATFVGDIDEAAKTVVVFPPEYLESEEG